MPTISKGNDYVDALGPTGLFLDPHTDAEFSANAEIAA